MDALPGSQWYVHQCEEATLSEEMDPNKHA